MLVGGRNEKGKQGIRRISAQTFPSNLDMHLQRTESSLRLFNMAYPLACLLIVAAFCGDNVLAFVRIQHFVLGNGKSTQTSPRDLSFTLQVITSLGSDALERPEDENSPEFKEYLKQLLDMQSNRARNGFAAPSSGSSDAYFSKLNRIKLEKIARRKAGLPDDEVDTAYRAEDYLLVS